MAEAGQNPSLPQGSEAKMPARRWPVLRFLLRHRSARAGGALVLVLALASLLGPFLSPYDPYIGVFSDSLQGPSVRHPLGTDELGRDLLTRVLHGGRLSLLIGVLAAALGVAIGVPLGAVSGYVGGRTDLLIQRGVDIAMAFPGIVLAIIVVNILGMGLWNAMIAIGISAVPGYIRLVRGVVLIVREEDYVMGSRAIGASPARTLLWHVVPNTLGVVIVRSSLQIAEAILWAGALGFLGLGAQPPTPEWGAMLGTGRSYLRVADHMTVVPGLAIMLAVVGFNLLGDGLRDVLDPRTRQL